MRRGGVRAGVCQLRGVRDCPEGGDAPAEKSGARLTAGEARSIRPRRPLGAGAAATSSALTCSGEPRYPPRRSRSFLGAQCIAPTPRQTS